MPADHPLVVFDGVCNFCSWGVRFIMKRDRRRLFRFVPLQSPLGSRLLREHGFDPDDAETFLLVEGDRVWSRSEAAIEVARRLPRWGWTRALRLVPRAVRDWCYTRFARNRYRLFGRRETCVVPSPEERALFLEDDAG